MQSPRLRILALTFALLHLLVQPFATLADAWVHREAALAGPPTVHIESHGSPDCARVHPVDCAFCSVATTLAIAPPLRPELPGAARMAPMPAQRLIGAADAGRVTTALPRAPPVA